MPANKLTHKISVLLASIGLGVIVLSGCGTSDSAPINGDFQDRGRQLFNAKCGTCHKMAAAASVGEQGPDLDDAFAAAREAGMDDDTIRGVVHAQVKRPQPSVDGFPGVSMPANIVTGKDLDDVAEYVARYAGVPGAKPPIAPGEGPGAQVYANNGCGSCHVLAAAESAGVLGPNLDEVIPEMSRAEIEQSILDPNAKKPAGYENAVMPDRFDSIPKDQLNDLIQFLMSSAAADNS
ncbi:MAG TPA: c-type cytochrome [Solirubrobacterales bacterium]|nr:c-type cytochrome [Solirubrobacterales bacterium]